MIIANCQTIHRVYKTAGSALYRARRLTDGMPVLLKLLPEHAGTVQSARLKREYRLLQTLKVAGIAKPHSLIDDRGRLVLVLEDFSGECINKGDPVYRPRIRGRVVPLNSDAVILASELIKSTRA